MAPDPEQDVVRRLPSREHLDSERQAVACREQSCRHAYAPATVVGRWCEHWRRQARREARRVTLVPMVRQNDDRLAVSCEVEDRRGRGGRVDQQQPLAVVDRVRGDLWPPVAIGGVVLRRPIRVPGLPPPQTFLQLAHRGIVSNERTTTRRAHRQGAFPDTRACGAGYV